MKIGERILKAEEIKYDKKALEEFVEERNTSDIRGFINDLQASVVGSRFDPCDEFEIRDYKKQIEDLMHEIYFSAPENSYTKTFNTNISLDDLFLYLEENTPNAYAKGALIQAFNELAKADLFRGRIMKWQYWRFLVYVNFYLTFGVSIAKTKPSKTPIKRNSRILKKWIYGNKFNSLSPRTKLQKSKDEGEKFIEKLAKEYSHSVVRTRSQDLYYFVFAYRNSKEFQKSMNEKFEIDESLKKALMEL